jgi:hypothetical protein
MRRFILSSLMLILAFPLLAQNFSKEKLPSEPFIFKKDSTLLLLSQGDYEVQGRFLWNNFLYTNGDRVDFREVRFLQTEEDLFTVLPVRGLFGGTGYQFARCLEKGTVDVFVNYTQDGSGNRNANYFYSLGLAEAKPFSFNNLSQDLVLQDQRPYTSRNETIRKHLKAGKTKKNVRIGMLVGGLAIFTAGTIMYSRAGGGSVGGTVDPTAQRNGLIIGAGGIVLAGAPLLFVKPDKSYLKAVRLYNETY